MRSTRSPSSIERLLGFGPIAPPPDAFLCGPGELLYAGFGREGGAWTLREWVREELPADLFQEGLLGGPAREPAVLRERVHALVERLARPVKRASLVLPDAWLRTAFTEVGELPGGGEKRQEVLRWKLKRLVPFRVEELRLAAAELSPLPGRENDEENHRLLLGFALEGLLAQLEDAFEAVDVHIGRVTSSGLAAVGALADGLAADGAVVALVLVDESGYSLAFVRDGEPLLHRFKPSRDGSFSDDTLPGVVGVDAVDRRVGRDLRLTRTFLEDHFPDAPLAGALLVAPEAEIEPWARRVGDGLGVEVQTLDGRHLHGWRDAGAPAPAWIRLVPLLGAASQEVTP